MNRIAIPLLVNRVLQRLGLLVVASCVLFWAESSAHANVCGVEFAELGEQMLVVKTAGSELGLSEEGGAILGLSLDYQAGEHSNGDYLSAGPNSGLLPVAIGLSQIRRYADNPIYWMGNGEVPKLRETIHGYIECLVTWYGNLSGTTALQRSRVTVAENLLSNVNTMWFNQSMKGYFEVLAVLEDAAYEHSLVETHRTLEKVTEFSEHAEWASNQERLQAKVGLINAAKYAVQRIRSQIAASLNYDPAGSEQLNEVNGELQDVQHCLESYFLSTTDRQYALCYVSITLALDKLFEAQAALHETRPWVRDLVRATSAMGYLSIYQSDVRGVWNSVFEATEDEPRTQGLFSIATFHRIIFNSEMDSNRAAQLLRRQACRISYVYSSFWEAREWPEEWPLAAEECVGVCGDGTVAGLETCDDKNEVEGDGCSPTCQIEYGFGCIGTANEDGMSFCFPCPQEPEGNAFEAYCYWTTETQNFGASIPEGSCTHLSEQCAEDVDAQSAVIQTCVNEPGRPGYLWVESSLCDSNACDSNLLQCAACEIPPEKEACPAYPEGFSRCVNNRQETCTAAVSGCRVWEEAQDCGASDLGCVDGSCQLCPATCTSGQRRCSPNISDGVETCELNPASGCWEWAITTVCPGSQKCITPGACYDVSVTACPAIYSFASCADYCGDSSGCYCDPACFAYNDCCQDICEYCVYPELCNAAAEYCDWEKIWVCNPGVQSELFTCNYDGTEAALPHRGGEDGVDPVVVRCNDGEHGVGVRISHVEIENEQWMHSIELECEDPETNVRSYQTQIGTANIGEITQNPTETSCGANEKMVGQHIWSTNENIASVGPICGSSSGAVAMGNNPVNDASVGVFQDNCPVVGTSVAAVTGVRAWKGTNGLYMSGLQFICTGSPQQ